MLWRETQWILGIAHGLIEIHHAVQGVAGANPLVQRLPHCITNLRIIRAALVVRQGHSENPESVPV